eukprot:359425-Chlamydomonas_euryale.AAC.6
MHTQLAKAGRMRPSPRRQAGSPNRRPGRRQRTGTPSRHDNSCLQESYFVGTRAADTAHTAYTGSVAAAPRRRDAAPEGAQTATDPLACLVVPCRLPRGARDAGCAARAARRRRSPSVRRRSAAAAAAAFAPAARSGRSGRGAAARRALDRVRAGP